MVTLPDRLAADLDPDGAILASLQRGRTLPSDWYTDEGLFDLEQKLIFARGWDFVGHKAQVHSPGDYFTCVSAGVPIVVVCGKDRKVRAFLNICRHRMNPVAVGSGRQPLLVCRYHSWTYRLDGSFNAAPRSREDAEFDGTDLGLSPIAIDQWGDMIFVNPTNDAPPLAKVLGPILERSAKHGVPVARSKFRESRSIEFDANWKIAWDNNSECYHCPTVHSAWFKEAQLGPDAISSFPIGPYHFQHVMKTRPDSPIDNHFFCWPTFTLATDSSSGPGFAQRTGGAQALAMGHLGYFVWRWVPVSARRTRIELHLFTEQDIDQAIVDDWYDALLKVLHEDKAICESVQASHDSGVAKAGTLITAIDSEYQIQVWQLLVHRALTQPETALYEPLLEPSSRWRSDETGGGAEEGRAA